MEPLPSDCWSLLKQMPNKRMLHIYHEANQCADVLAKLGIQASSHFIVFCNPPLVVENLLAFDKTNMFYNRLVNS